MEFALQGNHAQQILQFCDAHGISLKNLLTMGSDGAAVMTGRHVSVPTLFIILHYNHL